MEFDVFFSLSQTPVNGFTPSEAEMYSNFFEQIDAADQLGFGVGWVAESHFSSEVQKRHAEPVIPHWKGEVGLNTDILQLSHHVFQRTKRIEMGSAVMNIVCQGGPLAHAERVASFCTLHGLDAKEKRRLHCGFAAGRFDFMNRVSGVVARNEFEKAFWPVVKGKIFSEAAEIFLRLLTGETLSSAQVSQSFLKQADFRSEEDWARARELGKSVGLPIGREGIHLPNRWNFEATKIIPQDWRRDLLQLVIGSHEPGLQERVNQWAPVQVFNLSITRPEVIEDTHRRMSKAYHLTGGAWRRSMMPRTVFVFLNEEKGLSPEERQASARREAEGALSAYWTALEGTVDKQKVAGAANNALVGNADDVASAMVERFHPEDRLMLWFDFFNHDSKRVVRNMEKFMSEVKPRVEKMLAYNKSEQKNEVRV